MSFTPYSLRSLILLVVPREVGHVPLTGVSDRIFVAVKLPERVFVEFENERDDLEDFLDNVVVGVVRESSNLGEEGKD